MQLVQKPTAKTRGKLKIVGYLVLIFLVISCKPYLHNTGFMLSFDYRVGLNRIFSAGAWLAVQIQDQSKPVQYKYKEATK